MLTYNLTHDKLFEVLDYLLPPRPPDRIRHVAEDCRLATRHVASCCPVGEYLAREKYAAREVGVGCLERLKVFVASWRTR
jgi:hypothetical protein